MADLTAAYEPLLENAQRIWEMAPEEIKEGGANFLAAAADLAGVLTLHQTEIRPLSQLCANMRNGMCISAAEANCMLDTCGHAIVADNRTEIFNSLVSRSVCNEAVVKQMEEAMRSTANKFLVIGAVSSFFFIVVEAVRLWNFWETIKEARNIVEKSSQERVRISQDLEAINGEIGGLNAFITEILTGRSEEIVRVRAMRQIGKIRRKLDTVQMNIRELEVEVDRKKVRLADSRRLGKVSVATNLVTGGTIVTNVLLFAAMANPILIGVNAALAVTNGFLAAGNVAACIISSKDLERIEEELRQLGQLKRYRQELEDTLESKAEELWDLLEDRLR